MNPNRKSRDYREAGTKINNLKVVSVLTRHLDRGSLADNSVLTFELKLRWEGFYLFDRQFARSHRAENRREIGNTLVEFRLWKPGDTGPRDELRVPPFCTERDTGGGGTLGVKLRRKGWTRSYMPSNKQQLPEVNYDALGSGPGKKRGGYLAFILLILLLGGAFFFFRNRLSWFAHVLTSEPSTVTQSTPNAESPRPPVPQPKLKPKKLAVTELPSTASPATNAPVTRSIISAEVIFPGGQHRTIYPHNTAVNLDLGGSTKPTSVQTQPATAVATAVNPAEHENVSTDSPEVLDHPAPVYPRLAGQMKVEGSVTLQVNIDQNGNIVGTKVLSGPDILANAAKEAVRRWRFRPRYKNGAPIETDARVIVNFTISTR